jgi:two-component system sensor histidine kinase DesK
VVRHSDATRVRIALTPSSVEVTDDGTSTQRRADGIESVNDLDRGTGLSGLRERLRAAGGTLTVGPVAGGGWRLRAEVPT